MYIKLYLIYIKIIIYIKLFINIYTSSKKDFLCILNYLIRNLFINDALNFDHSHHYFIMFKKLKEEIKEHKERREQKREQKDLERLEKDAAKRGEQVVIYPQGQEQYSNQQYENQQQYNNQQYTNQQQYGNQQYASQQQYGYSQYNNQQQPVDQQVVYVEVDPQYISPEQIYREEKREERQERHEERELERDIRRAERDGEIPYGDPFVQQQYIDPQAQYAYQQQYVDPQMQYNQNYPPDQMYRDDRREERRDRYDEHRDRDYDHRDHEYHHHEHHDCCCNCRDHRNEYEGRRHEREERRDGYYNY